MCGSFCRLMLSSGLVGLLSGLSGSLFFSALFGSVSLYKCMAKRGRNNIGGVVFND